MFKKEEVLPVVGAADVARKVQLDYSRGVKDQNEKAVEGVNELFSHALAPNFDIVSLARETCDLVCRRFGIASASVALRSAEDHRYRYVAVVGLSDQVVADFMKISYAKDDLLNPAVYKSHEVSKYSRIFLAEEHPYADGEEFSYTHPGLMGMKRRSLTDSLEADYIDTFILDSDGDIFGYIEISGTRLRKLPDTVTIKWVELIAHMLSAAIRLRGENALRTPITR